MPNRYDKAFGELRAKGGKAFIPFTVLGWPDEETSFQIIKTMIESGVTCLELGIAFSDPVADGPTIQQASFATLASGFTVDDAFSLVKRVRALNDEIPIGLLVYYNIVLAMGTEKFFERARECGADGVLVADLPVECADELLPITRKTGIVPIFIISPMTTEDRINAIVKDAGGFLYLVSRLGVTGTKDRDAERDSRLRTLIESVHSRSSLPVCAGFGISSPSQARAMIELGADGVITGSRVIELVSYSSPSNCVDVLGKYFAEMLAACTPTGAGCQK
ncbi:MAG TPA: tryptophan synthase subunit alpha [Candidatus Obscuribacterales bacterium]